MRNMQRGLVWISSVGLLGCAQGAEPQADTLDPTTFNDDDIDDESESESESSDDATADDATTDDATTDDDDDVDTTTDDGGAICGNGAIEGSEVCDTGDLGGATCQSEGFGGGGLACAADCTLDTSNCDTCGNDMVDAGEDCDGSDLGRSSTCADLNLGADDEALGCTEDCTYDFGLCSGCGDGVITDPEQCEPASELLDKAELGGATCMSLGFDDGLLDCSEGCTFNTASCYDCGDAEQQGQEECDGADFGGQACSDYMSMGGAPFEEGSLSCDPDCTIDTGNCSVCGDGVVTGAEVCEPGVLGGATCLTEGFDGGSLACMADCSDFQTAACTDCGDGTIEGNEQCDFNNLGGQTCNTLGFPGGGTLGCTNACAFNTSQCANNFCGDGIVNGMDECDCGNQGANCTAGQLNNQNCVSQGFDGGALACFSPNNCDYNTVGCYECGDGNINPGEQCDGGNLAGQTCVSQGYVGGGTLSCAANCSFNAAQCVNTANPYVACVNPNLPITGAGPGAGNPSIINVPSAGTITDVNISIDCLHVYVGDLDFTLTHNATSRVVIDQPGAPASLFGCFGDDIDATLDDEAATLVEGVCAASAPTILSPPSYRPNNLMSGFDGQNMQGNWNLIIDDTYPQADDGTLLQWCVEITWQ
jgi:hypothetical protein